jgi:hypothetical protein
MLWQTTACIALLSSSFAVALRAQAATDRDASVLERTVDATIHPGQRLFLEPAARVRIW